MAEPNKQVQQQKLAKEIGKVKPRLKSHPKGPDALRKAAVYYLAETLGLCNNSCPAPTPWVQNSSPKHGLKKKIHALPMGSC